MIHPPDISPEGWSSVRRWTLFGTLGCTLASVLFNLALFSSLGTDALVRALISATVLPIVLGTPLFFYLSMRVRSLAILNRRLSMVARTDSLTACLTRGAFTARVETILSAPETTRTGALLMIDADNFKAINDLHGHYAGDEALTIIARAIRAMLRGSDLVGRMGGEEFAVFLPGLNEQQAAQVAERIRYSVNHALFEPDGMQSSLSVSLGGAAFERPTRFTELFRIADQCLYAAKQSGRNRSRIVRVDDYPMIALKKIA